MNADRLGAIPGGAGLFAGGLRNRSEWASINTEGARERPIHQSTLSNDTKMIARINSLFSNTLSHRATRVRENTANATDNASISGDTAK